MDGTRPHRQCQIANGWTRPLADGGLIGRSGPPKRVLEGKADAQGLCSRPLKQMHSPAPRDRRRVDPGKRSSTPKRKNPSNTIVPGDGVTLPARDAEGFHLPCRSSLNCGRHPDCRLPGGIAVRISVDESLTELGRGFAINRRVFGCLQVRTSL